MRHLSFAYRYRAFQNSTSSTEFDAAWYQEGPNGAEAVFADYSLSVKQV